MLARPWPLAKPVRVTASPTKLVPLFGEARITGATALVDQTLVAASLKVVATTKLLTVKKAVPNELAWRKPKPRAAVGEVTASDDTTFKSPEESGLTHKVAANKVTGSHCTTT